MEGNLEQETEMLIRAIQESPYNKSDNVKDRKNSLTQKIENLQQKKQGYQVCGSEVCQHERNTGIDMNV